VRYIVLLLRFSNLYCEWIIQAVNATDAVRLEVTDAAIEYHADCVYDTGEVFNGNLFNCSFIHLFVHSFIRPFDCSPVRSIVHPSVRSFDCPSVRSFVH